MSFKEFPYEIELIINKYVHQLKMIELKKELTKNFKISFVYNLTWKGDFDYFKAYQNLEKEKNLSLYFKNKLINNLSNIVYND